MRGPDYMALVHKLPCALCKRIGFMQRTRTEGHHARTGQGGAQRASDFLAIALCTDCHTGKTGIHGDKGRLRQANVDEMDLLADTIAAVHNLKDE